jgi:hypothetical protein
MHRICLNLTRFRELAHEGVIGALAEGNYSYHGLTKYASADAGKRSTVGTDAQGGWCGCRLPDPWLTHLSCDRRSRRSRCRDGRHSNGVRVHRSISPWCGIAQTATYPRHAASHGPSTEAPEPAEATAGCDPCCPALAGNCRPRSYPGDIPCVSTSHRGMSLGYRF